MAATAKQFLQEVGKLLKPLCEKHHASRADYKTAAEALSVKKMPKATEDDRRKFVLFALKVFDLIGAVGQYGFDASTPVAEVGKALAGEIN